MKVIINDIHEEIKEKIHEFNRDNTRKPKYLVLNMRLWFDIQKLSKEVIPPEHIQEPDGYWRIFGLKVAILDGSSLQARHLEVIG